MASHGVTDSPMDSYANDLLAVRIGTMKVKDLIAFLHEKGAESNACEKKELVEAALAAACDSSISDNRHVQWIRGALMRNSTGNAAEKFFALHRMKTFFLLSVDTPAARMQQYVFAPNA